METSWRNMIHCHDLNSICQKFVWFPKCTGFGVCWKYDPAAGAEHAWSTEFYCSCSQSGPRLQYCNQPVLLQFNNGLQNYIGLIESKLICINFKMYFVICQIVFVQIVKAAILQSARASRLQFNNGPEILGPTSGFATNEIISLMAKLAMLHTYASFLIMNQAIKVGNW